MEAVKRVDFKEGMKFIIPVIRELARLAIPYKIDEKEKTVTFKVPVYVPIRMLKK